MKALARCPYHRRIFVAIDSKDSLGPPKEQVCSLCWDIDEYKAVNWLVYPPSVAQFLKKHGHSYQMLPPHRRSCPVLHSSNPIEFIYPKNEMALLIPRDVDGNLQKFIAKAAHNTRKSEIFWYLDSKFYGATIESEQIQTHSIAIETKKGDHKLTIIDSDGNARSISFSAAERN